MVDPLLIIGPTQSISRIGRIRHSAARRLRHVHSHIDVATLLEQHISQIVGREGIAGEPMVERVLDGILHDPRRLGGCQPILCLPLEFRFANEDREHGAGALIACW